nr:titin homolog [Lytechinus pictus]
MAESENEPSSENEEFLSPVKDEVSDRDYTPPPRQKKQKVRRLPTHKATCPKNPSRRLIFSSQDEQDPSPLRHCTKKKRKMRRRKSGRSKKQKFEGRNIEVLGTWVQCTNKDCMKWRYLSDITDPSHVPDEWTCEMNSDSSYNSCLLPEQDYSTLEFVHAKFTEGSLVWAKMQGFPWWPAMIEEDPDSELCLYPDPLTGYVTDYHVVFLDKKVTRCWVKVSNIQKYEDAKCPGSMIVKGHDYSQRIMAAKEVADKAQKVPIKERIKTFGFSARFKGPWGEDTEKTSVQRPKTELHKRKGPKPKKRVIMDEDSSLAGSLLSHSDMDDILDEAEALLGEVHNIVMEVEDEVQESLLQEMEKGEKDSPPPLKKRKVESGKNDEQPSKQKQGTSKNTDDSSPQPVTSGKKSRKIPKEKQSSETKMAKELERIQKKKEAELHKLELQELKVREKIERREKEKQAKKEQKAKEKQKKNENKQKVRQEEKEAEKEKSKQEKKELKRKEKEAKKELKKKKKAEKKLLKKSLEGETDAAIEGKDSEGDAEKAARKEKKRLEKEEKKRLKKEMKAKKKEEKKKEGNDGKATDQKEKEAAKVKPSFQKAKKPTFSAPKQKAAKAPLGLPAQPTTAEESSVSKEIGALIDEIVNETDRSIKIDVVESSVAASDVPAVKPSTVQSMHGIGESPVKNVKKPFRPKFSIKTKDGQRVSEANLPDSTASSAAPTPVNDGGQDTGLDALDEETSVDISKILEVNSKQDSTVKTDQAQENNSDPLAFPLSEMIGKQLELLPKSEHQDSPPKRECSVNIDEAQGQDSHPTKEINDVIADSTKLVKTLEKPIKEYIPDSTDWSEPDEPQTVPGQKMVMVAAAANGNDSEDSDPFEMED